MTYPECLSYLEKLGDEVLSMRFGLETIRTLLQTLENPQLEYRSILVAGTNGKGSVGRFLSASLTACGLRNGLYTSPHVVQLEERFMVDDKMIEPESFARCLTRVVQAIEELELPHHPTYFETLTTLVFLYFAEENIDVATLEVGMGGRLDSTNVVEPMLSILTPIGLDHQKFLGQRLEEIAREKAGILRAGCPALSAPQEPEVARVLQAEATAKGARLEHLDSASLECLGSCQGRYSFSFRGLEYQLQLRGRHQVENAALALQAVETLRGQGMELPEDRVHKGVSSADWIGRIQVLGENPTLVLDGAHNVDAARRLVDFLREHTSPPRTLVFGIMSDKDVADVLETLKPLFERIYLTSFQSRRAATPDQLKRFLPTGIVAADPFEAWQQARQTCPTLVAAGSFYLVGEILKKL